MGFFSLVQKQGESTAKSLDVSVCSFLRFASVFVRVCVVCRYKSSLHIATKVSVHFTVYFFAGCLICLGLLKGFELYPAPRTSSCHGVKEINIMADHVEKKYVIAMIGQLLEDIAFL